MQHLLDLSKIGLGQLAQDRQWPAYRALQIARWVFEKRACDFGDMTDLPKSIRDDLATIGKLWSCQTVTHSASADGSEKLLLELSDRGRIECVLLRDEERRTICVSSQVGCAMGCVFCASGLDGVDRNLTTGEIVEQMLLLQHRLPTTERLSHIVVMGMGEPLANLDRLLPALEIASDPHGLGISPRRITISTVGIPKAIRRLADECPRYHLAVSLHAPNDELRNQLVPVNKSTGLGEILAAADHYFDASGRKLTFEYVLLAGLNDFPQHAHELVRLLRGRTALLNVIPYNPVSGLPFRTPSTATQTTFREILEQGGLAVRFRRRKGDKINAACGQLRRSTPPLVSLTDLSEKL